MDDDGGTCVPVRDGEYISMASNVPNYVGASMEVDGDSLIGQ